jgi:hypothetical protein
MSDDAWKIERHDRFQKRAQELGYDGIASALEATPLAVSERRMSQEHIKTLNNIRGGIRLLTDAFNDTIEKALDALSMKGNTNDTRSNQS